MKVILTQDVESIGRAGQIINVANGFARNKLIPDQLAVTATPANLRLFEKKREEFKLRAMKEKERSEKLAAQIETLHLVIAQKAGESDKLYGSVTTMDLAAALKEKGLDLDRRKIQLEENIKSLGEYEVPIKLHSEVTAHVKVTVVKAE